METIQPPKSLSKGIKIRNRLLLGPGPSNVSDRVAHATAFSSGISHIDPQFHEIFEDVKDGLRYVFQTKNETTFCITASGHAAMEATVANILESGDTLATGINGLWGQRMAAMASRIGCKVATVQSKSLSEPIEFEAYEKLIRDHRPKLLYVCHGDSSTGVLQSLDGLGKVCSDVGTILMVDAVASLLSAPVEMDKLGIDILFTASQKCLSAHAGVACISLSERAMDSIRNRKTKPSSLYLDIIGISNSWGCNGCPHHYHSTPAIAVIVGLREALAIVVERGLDSVVREHQEVSRVIQNGLEKLGLEMFVANSHHRLPSVLSVKIPKGVDANAFRRHLLTKYDIEVAGGLGPSAGTVWRIGVMGHNATHANAKKLLDAMKDALHVTKSNL